ncbi:MAG TPA: sigma-54-dependent Fis family transcriptional regulator, partial [Myxococcota bacterium]|nr:sigma-54-dependent Fis family transcriptional regulator [Myxococcota bacterium]
MSDTRPRTDGLPARGQRVESVRIRVIDGVDGGREVLLARGECDIGTEPGCMLRLNDTAISRRHCRITLGDSGIKVTDLGSRNGTFYLGVRCSEVVVELGATLSLGRSKIQLATPELAGITTSKRDRYGDVVGATPVMRHLFHVLEQLEPVDSPVLLLGETGVGKTMVARAIHDHSRRAGKPFEVFDCGAAAKQLIESELFGHVRGAFTSAAGDRAGVFVRADAGTVFLDEIGELPLESQPKLLRVIDEKKLRAVGSNLENRV